MRHPTTTVALFASLVIGAAFLLVVSEVGRIPTLTSAEVRADAQRLQAMAARTRIDTPATGRLVQLTYTFVDRCGGYQGLALITDWKRSGAPAEPETLLGFVAVPGPERLPRGPARPPLPTLYFQRDPMATDLVPPGHPRRLLVSFAPAGWEEGEPRTSITLGNVAGQSDLAGAIIVDYALGPVVGPQHCKLAPEDPRVLAVLARLVRARLCDAPGSDRFCASSAVTLFRDARPGAYRLDVRALGADPRRAAFGLEVSRDRKGRLLAAEVRLLPDKSSLDRRAVLTFDRPRPAAAPLVAGTSVELIYEPETQPESPAPVTVDLAALLAGTSWQGD